MGVLSPEDVGSNHSPEIPPMKPEEGRSSATIVLRAPKVMDNQMGAK